ncbi:MAG: hypothetical protein RMM58_07720 [Chloroflexota bacterium]|nr:hypothetical protein [Dehalococcoidia bacterium]MDW8253749.1 hypothetical protein [Chloroflexota bacterium]
MNVMRYTVVDQSGRVSFIGPCAALIPLVAACSRNPTTLSELLAIADQYGANIGSYVEAGLAVFDEHNLPGNYSRIHAALDFLRDHEVPVFRVVDDRTRDASLKPVAAGAVIFNLTAKRIVQIQNTYQDIQRVGIVRELDASGKTTRIHRYRLPAEWVLAP